jgi:hypothetical protein
VEVLVPDVGDSDVQDAQSLRQLAGDALAAAECLEANTRS